MLHVSFQTFKTFMFHVEVTWVVMLCSEVVGYQHFIGPCCLHLHLTTQKTSTTCWMFKNREWN